MKTKNQILKWLVLSLVASFSLISCKKDEAEPAPSAPASQTIAEVAVSGGFDSLVKALTKAGLVSTFADPSAEFTVFAPTNAAFVQLLNDLDLNSINEIPDELLVDVLQYHVFDQKVLSSDLSENLVAPTLGNYTVRFTLSGGAKVWTSSEGFADISTPDVIASNGVIHVINKVLVPNLPSENPTNNIVEVALANGFDSLAKALTVAGLVSVFEGDDVYTVFAPTNQAFIDLLDDLGLTNISQIPTETLTAVLTYHVTPGYVFSDQLVSNLDVGTLNNVATFKIKINGSAVSIEDALSGNTDASVTAANVRATNGVVHVIDKVLRP
jgi:transforming growth factor-beta-induced protein